MLRSFLIPILFAALWSAPGIAQMLTRVRAEVVAATKAKQVPWSNSSLLGEIYLAEK